MHVHDTWKTAFKIKFSLFEWMVMPARLTNAPTTFMRVINYIFRPHLGNIVVIYLDDIQIFNKTWIEHMHRVGQVFQIIKERKLKVKENKSFFGQQSIQYLGFTIDQKRIHPNASHIQSLAQWPVHTSTTQLKSFMGGINYYCKFVSQFSQWARLIHQLANTKKFQWSPDDDRNFARVKQVLCSTPILRLPDLQQPF